MSEPKPKSFEISKWAVWEAYRRVKANKGGAGVDGESMAEFEQDLHGNLYKLWNRLSSGSYFPPPVRAVEIPKRDGSPRILGVPTVADRIAQTVVRGYLEPDVEPVFHEDSYGYRPGRSAHQALRVCRERCWRQDWVLDLDLKSFFDSVRWDLILKAVAHHTDLRWVLLYVERWLKAPLQREDGSLVWRDRGTPQGSAISPLLANMMLHYAFDAWMAREHPTVQFERYCDDIIVHARSERQARQLWATIAKRLAECGLELNERKTRIVYCKDDDRRGSWPGGACDLPDTRAAHRRGQNTGDGTQRAGRPADLQVGQRGAQVGRAGESFGAWSRRAGQAAGGREAGGTGHALCQGGRADRSSRAGTEDPRPVGLDRRSRRAADPQGQARQADRVWLCRADLRGHREHSARRARDERASDFLCKRCG